MNLDGTGARFDPVANSWTTMATAGAPAGLTYFLPVWTGTGMLVVDGPRTGGYYR